MAESNTISLVIPPEPSSKSQALESQIQQIIAQKGHFRHVTERSLLAEIHGKATAPDVAQERPEEELAADDDETPQKRTERLWERRNQMLERLGAAQNDILCALDFVSWLISQQSVPARHSMSAPLKEAAPVGSLVAKVLEEKPISPPVRRQLVSVSQGWRSEGFHLASNKLSAASSRLEAEAEHQSQFWKQVADLRAKGWPISRLPRDRKAIGVHFGFAEAAPQFRDRGFALLLQAADGSVGLDARSLPKKRRRLAVYVIRNANKTGAFHFESPRTSETMDISQQLTDHRDALFEEELFFEICREARLVGNQGITTRARSVGFDVGDYRLLLVSSDEQEAALNTNNEDDSIAEFVGISLRLLLNVAHEQNRSRRMQKAPPMAIKARTMPEYPLLRPILTHLRHRSEARAFWTSIQTLLHAFETASLPTTMSMENSNDAVFASLKMESPNTLLSELMVPAKTSFALKLTTGRNLQVGLATFLGPPLLGCRYETSPIDFGFSKIPSCRHETRDVALASVRHMLLLELVAHAEALTRTDAANAEADKSRHKKWSLSQPHSGELTMYFAQEAVRRMQLSVHTESISLKGSPVKQRPSSSGIVWSWTAAGCFKAEGNATTKEEGTTFDAAVRQLLATDS
ncbi:hypothetical protein G647_10336 [Cladophialophora carrionii CBS 160.54]|uniref:Mediator of RNA polymerase II transcription subunit 17 n=1 Tax=Cladophialophora carrionii CBS 160.54 TaxID=1279043 RepID=V9DJ00_9EURO|nr:uncharacterized protein G647_10336 [Cladophialophora carrionii CBS 160.54]ETI26676.1 hypothetical protein G647_10336 [Cladophialophora carrionii CBS 160.54]